MSLSILNLALFRYHWYHVNNRYTTWRGIYKFTIFWIISLTGTFIAQSRNLHYVTKIWSDFNAKINTYTYLTTHFHVKNLHDNFIVSKNAESFFHQFILSKIYFKWKSTQIFFFNFCSIVGSLAFFIRFATFQSPF